MSVDSIPILQPLAPEATSSQSSEKGRLFSDGTPSFEDILDAINPLQQLPVVGSIYRENSGDGMSIFSRLVGGLLFGGPIGFLVAAVNAGVEAATGSDIGEHMIAMLDSSEQQPSEIQMADVAARYQNTQQLT